MTNPFTFGESLSPKNLVDREREVEQVTQSLLDGGRLFVIGPRRYGKTSILKAARVKATAQGVRTIVVNVESQMSLAALAGEIVSEVAALFEPTIQERSSRIVEWFSGLRPQVNYEALTDTISVSISAGDYESQSRDIATALNAADKFAAERGARIGIILDEFQEISKREGLPSEQQLRAVVQEHHHLSYVFAGSDTTLLLAMINQHSRPFYRLGGSMFIDAIPRPDMRAFIRKSFDSHGLNATAEGVEQILNLASDTPYNIQKLAARAFAAVRSGEIDQLDLSGASYAIDRVLIEEKVNHLALFKTFTPKQRRFLVAMADPRYANYTLAKLSRTIQVAYSTLRSARESLVKTDVLRPTYESVDDEYVFVDPFFALWITRFTSGTYD